MFEMVAIGNPVFDIIITPYIKTNGRVLSGCSTNAALTYGKLGGSAALVGRVGNDYIKDLVEISGQYNVKAFPLPSKVTGGFYLKYIDERMSKRELRVINTAGIIRFEEIPGEALEADAFILGPILKEIDLDFVKRLINEREDALIFVDPQGLIRGVRKERVILSVNDDVYKIIKLTNITKPNEHEAEALFPGKNPAEAAKAIFKLNNFVGIVTVAERGSYVAFKGGVFHIPAYRTKEQDPTGCGDIYAGAFVYYYLRNEDIVESAAFASAAASFKVETTGPHFPMKRKEVEQRFERILEGIKKVD